MATTLIHVHIEGLQSLKNKLKNDYMKEVRRRANNALVKTGEFIMDKSREVVPIDTGDLSKSGFVRPVMVGGNMLMVKIGYDDWKAALVHLQPWLLHGEEFNVAYASQIAAGMTHARRPQEVAEFMTAPIHDNLKEIRYAFRYYFERT